MDIVPERIPGAKPRNVVFILADDHRYDAMSFLGHQFARTPVMDSIARQRRVSEERAGDHVALLAQPRFDSHRALHLSSSGH